MKRLNEQNSNTPEDFDRLFEQRIKRLDAKSRPDQERWNKFMKKFEGGRFLDVACGLSPVTQQIKRKFPDAEVWALDFASKMIETLRQKYPEVNYIVGDCRDTPFKDAYFDYIIAGAILEHMDRPEVFLKEMFRILKKNGVFVLSTPCEEGITIEIKDMYHLWGFTEEDIESLLEEHGQVTIEKFSEKIYLTIMAYCKKY